MPIMQNQGWTFNTVAELYDRFRPGYPDELYVKLFDYIPLSDSSRTVEVGIGAGQATLPVLKTGCAVTAVEYGDQLAQLCREKYAGFPMFSVITGKFEDVTFPDDSFDLIYAAASFHWVPEQAGYSKVFQMLRPGGAFARWANHPFRAKHQPELFAAIDRAYAEFYYPYYHRQPEAIHEYTEEQAEQRARIAQTYGFTDIRYALFFRTRTFSAGEYRSLLETYSDHIAMEERIRKPFLDRIEDAIQQHGGSISVHDTLDLQLARKP